MSDTAPDPDMPDDPESEEIPVWEDEYVDRVSDRLLVHYDMEKDLALRGERFTLYGKMSMQSQKHFFHPALSYAHHESVEHLFVRRAEAVAVPDLERLVDLGHDLADAWIEVNEEHYSTEFTFAVVAPTIPDDVRGFVTGFEDRTLLKFGYYGHYEVNLVVAAPDDEDLVGSREAHVADAFRVWEPIEREEPGLLGLIARRLQI